MFRLALLVVLGLMSSGCFNIGSMPLDEARGPLDVRVERIQVSPDFVHVNYTLVFTNRANDSISNIRASSHGLIGNGTMWLVKDHNYTYPPGRDCFCFKNATASLVGPKEMIDKFGHPGAAMFLPSDVLERGHSTTLLAEAIFEPFGYYGEAPEPLSVSADDFFGMDLRLEYTEGKTAWDSSAILQCYRPDGFEVHTFGADECDTWVPHLADPPSWPHYRQ